MKAFAHSVCMLSSQSSSEPYHDIEIVSVKASSNAINR